MAQQDSGFPDLKTQAVTALVANTANTASLRGEIIRGGRRHDR
jgi:hypothetical protein